MPEIDTEVITYTLNVDYEFKLVKQNKKKKKIAAKRNQIINEKVERLESNRLIKEVYYQDWLSNVMVVKKKNGKPIVCIDLWISIRLA